MKIVFTDLDGTLLHLQTYSAAAAQPALDALQSKRIPLVFCTSKTRAEVEFWRDRLGNEHPFIVENGGAIYIPKGYFPFRISAARDRDRYQVIEFGSPYAELVDSLHDASRESRCEVLGFRDMTVAEICLRTHLPVYQAELAKRREYDEPFEILGNGTHNLLNAIEARGRYWTRGDRFYHITGKHDKAGAAAALTELFREARGAVETVAIGDGHNDTAILTAADIPIIVQSRFAVALKKSVPQSRVTSAPGPYGWNEAVLESIRS